mgnify:CR=1 FL=1
MSETLRIKRGDTWKATFTWQDSDGNVIDLTDCTARLQLRKKRRQVELEGTTYPAEIDLTTSNGGIDITGTEGKVEIEATATQTASLDPDNYVTDLEISFPDGTVTSSQTLDVIVERDVTYG